MMSTCMIRKYYRIVGRKQGNVCRAIKCRNDLYHVGWGVKVYSLNPQTDNGIWTTYTQATEGEV